MTEQPSHAQILQRIAENDQHNAARFKSGEDKFDAIAEQLRTLTAAQVKLSEKVQETHDVVSAFAAAKTMGNFLIWWSKVLLAVAAVAAIFKFELWHMIGDGK